MDDPRARLPCSLTVLYSIAGYSKDFSGKKYHYQAPSHISGREILSSGLVALDNFVNRE